MTAEISPAPAITLRLLERCPGVRALAWAGEELYVARGYDLLRGSLLDGRLHLELMGHFRPPWWRTLTSKTRLSFRLVRDGFHALAVLPSGHLVGAVPGAIVSLAPGEREFKITHKITRGTRPLHITATPQGRVLFGEYFDNAARDSVHIFASTDYGATWNVAYTFPPGAIRHIHNIAHDPWQDCLWLLTGDYGAECRILRASCDLRTVDVVMSGNQQARAVAIVPAPDGVYFSSDTPLEQNHVYHLDRRGTLSTLGSFDSSSIQGCRVKDTVFFTTMVEPSKVNPTRQVQVYAGGGKNGWHGLLRWKKDVWPMRFFQYGNAFLPDGHNRTNFLALTTVAVQADDLVTQIFEVGEKEDRHSG